MQCWDSTRVITWWAGSDEQGASALHFVDHAIHAAHDRVPIDFEGSRHPGIEFFPISAPFPSTAYPEVQRCGVKCGSFTKRNFVLSPKSHMMYLSAITPTLVVYSTPGHNCVPVFVDTRINHGQ